MAKESTATTKMGKLDSHLSSLWVIAALFIAVFITICIYVYAGEQKDLPQRHFGDVEINGELSGPGQIFTRFTDGTCFLSVNGGEVTHEVEFTQPANTIVTGIGFQVESSGTSTSNGLVINGESKFNFKSNDIQVLSDDGIALQTTDIGLSVGEILYAPIALNELTTANRIATVSTDTASNILLTTTGVSHAGRIKPFVTLIKTV